MTPREHALRRAEVFDDIAANSDCDKARQVATFAAASLRDLAREVDPDAA